MAQRTLTFLAAACLVLALIATPAAASPTDAVDDVLSTISQLVDDVIEWVVDTCDGDDSDGDEDSGEFSGSHDPNG